MLMVLICLSTGKLGTTRGIWKVRVEQGSSIVIDVFFFQKPF